MNKDDVQIPVTLTHQEAAEVEASAKTQGISPPDFLSYCARAILFGVVYAVRALPKQGHVGTQDEQE
jgi:hypothetical protein